MVNWAEVLTAVVRRGGSGSDLRRDLAQRGILGPEGLLTVASITEEDAQVAAELLPATSRAGLSLPDRLCLATGLRLRLPILTADRQWTSLAVPGCDVRLIRSIP